MPYSCIDMLPSALQRRRTTSASRTLARATMVTLCAMMTSAVHAQGLPELTLDSVLSAAAHQHPLLDAARARVAAARGARGTAATLPNPVFTYWTESARFPFQSSRPELQLETQTYATLPLELLYQRRIGLRAADARVDAAAADLVRARQSVALDAARAFYRVAEAQVVVAATGEVRDRLIELATYNAARVKEGRTAEADLIRTQVELDRLDASLTLAQIELTQARASLSLFLGRATIDADSVRVVIDDTPAPGAAATPTALPSLGALLTAARASRPDVIAARARVAAAGADAGSQRALTFRTVGATFGSKRTAGVTSMIAGFTLPLPVFDRNRGGVQQATALQRAAEAELVWADRQLAADVQAAFSSARSLAAQVARLGPTMLARAEESRRIALAAYQEGATTLLQVLDASRALADARQSWYRLAFAERVSRLALRAAIGDPALGASSIPTVDPARDDARPTLPSTSRLTRPTGDRP